VEAAEGALRRHLSEALFLSGEFDGRWRLVRVEWPHAVFKVTVADGHQFVLRLECSGYPMRAPTGTLWDLERQAMLEHRYWPRGTRCSQVFRTDWHNGSALYLPCDHTTIAQHHPGWVNDAPTLVWRPEIGITRYLEAVHGILQEHDLVYAKAADSVAAVV
jgi:hypothetical protein